jgi:hypothetical protein
MNVVFVALLAIGMVMLVIGIALIYPTYIAYNADRGQPGYKPPNSTTPSQAAPTGTPSTAQQQAQTKYMWYLIATITFIVLGIVMIIIAFIVKAHERKVIAITATPATHIITHKL